MIVPSTQPLDLSSETAILLLPADMLRQLASRYQRGSRAWLGGAATWPLGMPTVLGSITEQDLQERRPALNAWVQAWQQWCDGGALLWQEQHWPGHSSLRLPSRLLFASAEEVARCVGKAAHWARACSRLADLQARVRAGQRLAAGTLHDHAERLATLADEDWQRLLACLDAFAANPGSTPDLSKLNLPGVDAKWLERQPDIALTLRRLLNSVG